MSKNTSKDFLNTYKKLNESQKILENNTSQRLLDLCKQYPDAIIYRLGDTNIKAKSIGDKFYIQSLSFMDKVNSIIAIEKHIENLHPHKQLTIPFN